MPPIEDVERDDKRAAAVHEAGHAVAAVALGATMVRCWIERANPADPAYEKTWTGRAENIAAGLSGQKKAVVGLAGVVAEVLEDDPDIDPDELASYLDDETVMPSPTDWQMIGSLDSAFLAERASECVDLLKARWETVMAVAAELDETNVVTDARLLELTAGMGASDATD